jgi:hypothetical protein
MAWRAALSYSRAKQPLRMLFQSAKTYPYLSTSLPHRVVAARWILRLGSSSIIPLIQGTTSSSTISRETTQTLSMASRSCQRMRVVLSSTVQGRQNRVTTPPVLPMCRNAQVVTRPFLPAKDEGKGLRSRIFCTVGNSYQPTLLSLINEASILACIYLHHFACILAIDLAAIGNWTISTMTLVILVRSQSVNRHPYEAKIP